MSAFKTYEWQREKWPHLWKTHIKPEYRETLTLKLAKHFGIKDVSVSLTCGDDRGWCRKTFWGFQIILGRPSARCSLGTILHELAHAYCGQNEDERVGHSKKFKTALIKLIVESKYVIPSIFREIRKDRELESLKAESRMQSEITKAQKKDIVKSYKKTYEYKIAHLQTRIKRLERKEKSIGTRLKSARRSLKIMERLREKKREAGLVTQQESK